ncbi:MAG: hypothetical protein Q9N68_09615, partial [Gammaproteobacteria bacterium]|nr:hypothetical protein [Gammaproteobacteria bacterium]
MNHITQTISHISLPDFLLKNLLAQYHKKVLNETLNKASDLMRQTWIIFSRDHLLYDHRIQALWSYNSLEKEIFTPIKLSSKSDLGNAKSAIKVYFIHHKIALRTQLTPPTEAELKTSLYQQNTPPFPLENQRPLNSNVWCHQTGSTLQAKNLDAGYWTESPSGKFCSLLRLGKSDDRFNLTESERLDTWLQYGLLPDKLANDAGYQLLLRFQTVDALFLTLKEASTSERIILLENLPNFNLNEVIIAQLKNEDSLRADIQPYDDKMLTDIAQGNWALWPNHTPPRNKFLNTIQSIITQLPTNFTTSLWLRKTSRKKNTTSINLALQLPLVARNPVCDINSGVVGIDFGTKSTVVVCQKETTQIQPMRIGSGQLNNNVHAHQYENPTIMAFNDLHQFIEAYHSQAGRPHTRWQDLSVSHSAFTDLMNSHSNNFSAFLSNLKQWAGSNSKKLKVVDKKQAVFEFPEFLNLQDNDLNPIEIYAYYLGLYINTPRNGLFMDYILSFPVTYELAICDKIITSFERGIKKSLPAALHQQPEQMAKLRVSKGASEPAAYAVIALQENGFDPEEDERIFYGVFDFGGGTTDFDFGLYREACENKESRYDYAIEHFGAGGDRYLGGENLLELLA